MSGNVFFSRALDKAAGLLGRKGRVLRLLHQLATKLQAVRWRDVRAADLTAKFQVLGRLLKAYVTGRYREVPWKTMLLVTAAVIYFINPIDLIPDWFFGFGLTDDFGVLMSVYAAAVVEIDKFLAWERTQAPGLPEAEDPSGDDLTEEGTSDLTDSR